MSHIEDIIREKSSSSDEAEELISIIRAANSGSRQLSRLIDEIKEASLDG